MKKKNYWIANGNVPGNNAVHGLLTRTPQAAETLDQSELSTGESMSRYSSEQACRRDRRADLKIGFTHTPPRTLSRAAYQSARLYSGGFGCRYGIRRGFSGDSPEWQAAYENLRQAGCDG